MANSISTLGQQMNMINQVKNMQSRMADLQQQVATGVKYQTYSGYGSDALRIQNYRADLQAKKTYSYCIDIAQINIEQMNSAVDETITQAGNALSALDAQLTKGSEYDLESVKNAADSALKIIQANMNSKVGDRYLFAGTDVLNAPYDGADTATSNIQTQVTNWLNGTTADTDTFLANISGLTDSQLGYSTSVQSAKNIYARADEGLEVDYTVKATDDGFKKIVAGLTALANMQKPATTDTPTDDDFYNALDSLYKTVQSGIQGLRNASTKISAAAQVLDSVSQQHENDQQNIQKTMESTESADATTAIVTFQSIQNQLETSYQVTSILSQLSLARFLS